MNVGDRYFPLLRGGILALFPLGLDPMEKFLLVDQNPATSALNDSIKAITFSVENQMTEAPLRRPFVVIVPFWYWDETV